MAVLHAFAHAYSYMHKHTILKKHCLKMRSTPCLLLFGVRRTEKNKFCECASTLNFEISI